MTDETSEHLAWFFFVCLILYIPYLIWYVKKSNKEHYEWLARKQALSDLVRRR